MLEANIKELLKGKTIDELLDLIILGLEATNEKDSFINSFVENNVATETA